jgi:hypothetical protein
MTSDRLQNVDRFIDRHGKPRHYYRRGKGARIPLPGNPGSTAFMTAYAAAAGGDTRWLAKKPANQDGICRCEEAVGYRGVSDGSRRGHSAQGMTTRRQPWDPAGDASDGWALPDDTAKSE